MNVCVEDDRLHVDLDKDELARLHAAARKTGGGEPTMTDLKKALLDAVASFCDKGCGYRAKTERRSTAQV